MTMQTESRRFGPSSGSLVLCATLGASIGSEAEEE